MASEKYENLVKLIGQYKRDEIRAEVKAGVLKEVPEEKKTELLRQLVALRDTQLIKLLAKEMDVFSPEMLLVNFGSWQNRNFVAEILEKYPKKFDTKSDADSEKLFEIACTVAHPATAARLIKQKKAVSKYELLAGGADDMFALLKDVKPSELSVEQRLDILLAATQTEQETERLQQLAGWGFDLQEKTPGGASLNSMLAEKIKNKRYEKNKRGDLQRQKDKTALTRLYNLQHPKQAEEDSSEKMSQKKKLILLIVVICAAIVIGCVCYHATKNSGSSDTTTESELSTENETVTDSSAESEADSSAESETDTTVESETDTTTEGETDSSTEGETDTSATEEE